MLFSQQQHRKVCTHVVLDIHINTEVRTRAAAGTHALYLAASQFRIVALAALTTRCVHHTRRPTVIETTMSARVLHLSHLG
jgi:hypothetical protein